jgi:hypothetical protein
MPVADVTGSGLEVRKWTERLLLAKEKCGIFPDFMFARRDESNAISSDFEMDITDRLVWVHNHYPGVIPKEVHIYAHFGVIHSFGRGATTQALIVCLTEVIIDANNVCRKVERVKGKIQSQSIRDRYMEISKALWQQLKLSEGM